MKLIDEDGAQVTTLEQMKDRVVRHFLELFECSPYIPPLIDVAFDVQVSIELNAWIRSYPIEEEVKASLFSMLRGKVSGPDGIPVDILRLHWELVKHDLLKLRYFSFANGMSLNLLITPL